MDTGAPVWLLVPAGLAGVVVLLLRRASVLAPRAHHLKPYPAPARALSARLAVVADPFIAQLDEIRRRGGNPQGLAEVTTRTQDEQRAIAGEARSAPVPTALEPEATAFSTELE